VKGAFQMALKHFNGAVAVITGGASGIGLATAQALYQEGAHVVLADINEQGLQQAGQQVRAGNITSAGQVIVTPVDVTQEEQVQALMREALTINGRIDLVVTCAGIGRGGPFDLFTGEEMQKMMDINFMGTYHTVRAALPVMRRQGSGHYVLLSSVAGKLCTAMLTAYCASKWAVRGFASALRAELIATGARDINITTVYPAWVDTPMLHQEGNSMNLLHTEVLLTPQQVAGEILRAIQENQRDLTLVPNREIAIAVQIMHDDPDKAEQILGEAVGRHLQSAEPVSSSEDH
jgi:NAD(P)-dependent dehydrogenase (short-subunit alcohol dehydrogenase family)